MLWLIVPIAAAVFWLGRRSAKGGWYTRGFDRGWRQCATKIREAAQREERR